MDYPQTENYMKEKWSDIKRKIRLVQIISPLHNSLPVSLTIKIKRKNLLVSLILFIPSAKPLINKFVQKKLQRLFF